MNLNRVPCQKAGCTKDADRILHWDGYKRPVVLLCEEHAEAMLNVVHV